MAAYAGRMSDEGRFGELEAFLTQIAFAEYLASFPAAFP